MRSFASAIARSSSGDTLYLPSVSIVMSASYFFESSSAMTHVFFVCFRLACKCWTRIAWATSSVRTRFSVLYAGRRVSRSAAARASARRARGGAIALGGAGAVLVDEEGGSGAHRATLCSQLFGVLPALVYMYRFIGGRDKTKRRAAVENL